MDPWAPMWSCWFFLLEFSRENSGWWENGIENKGVMMITVSGDKIKVAESDKDGDFGEKQFVGIEGHYEK